MTICSMPTPASTGGARSGKIIDPCALLARKYPDPAAASAPARLPTGLQSFDRCLEGGLSKAALTEVICPRHGTGSGTIIQALVESTRTAGRHLALHPNTPRDHQTHLWEGSLRDPNGFFETLARLGGIVGSERVGVPCRLPTHRPNRFHLAAPNFDVHAPPSKTRTTPGCAAVLPLGLSLRRYRPPCRAAVESEDDLPARLQSREAAGTIKACVGPWRLDGNWWDDQETWRWEEWDVELDTGGLFRLAHHRQERWWMLGVYD